jgi:predicted DNA-binding transcriptional regulator AlpA
VQLIHIGLSAPDELKSCAPAAPQHPAPAAANNGAGRLPTIYKYIGEGTFPKSVSLGDRCVGWVDTEVQEWILARIEERDVTEGEATRS